MASNRVVAEEGGSPRLTDVDLGTGSKSFKREEEEGGGGGSELELHRAVFHGDLDTAKAELERGADASLQDRHGVFV